MDLHVYNVYTYTYTYMYTHTPTHTHYQKKVQGLTHSKAKQTKMSEFGAEKGLLQDQARYIVPKISGTLKGFQQIIITGQLRERLG